MGNLPWDYPIGTYSKKQTIQFRNEIVNHLLPLAFPGTNGCTLLTDFARRPKGRFAHCHWRHRRQHQNNAVEDGRWSGKPCTKTCRILCLEQGGSQLQRAMESAESATSHPFLGMMQGMRFSDDFTNDGNTTDDRFLMRT